uniref:Hypothetical conserved protein n=1 Tax=uncultured prokaryote TaxID=198431 RepID=H5SJX0_9ZZZZ|nr:hypothetical conserved protein [uncultured prokaryote]
MQVIKALVIGLGSSGIEVCDKVIERVRWELGDVGRAPWIRFLGIETNQTVDTALRDLGDLLLVTIDANEYSALLNGHPAYNERLHLNQWADLDVLRQLPANAVTAGAGNIRMVGRLVFFYRYNDISQQISARLNHLRTLTVGEAMERRGPLLSGENPPLVFNDNSLRIFVVGTLCGGTCSGMVSDFGFLLQLLSNPNDCIIGMFTLPSPNLTAAIEPKAERFKKNAYTALVELNHYHLTHREGEPHIIFPDGRQVDLHGTPYDRPYLFFPRGISDEDIDSLHRMIADRIFLNIFATGTDSAHRDVDAPRGDRFRRAHVFLNVGISTMEYPAERIVAACTNRQLAYTLGQWNRRTLDEAKVRSRLSELGLEWEKLREWLLYFPQLEGGSIRNVANSRKDQIVRLAIADVPLARQQLNELRQAFANRGIIPVPPAQELYPGAVVSTCLQNRDYAFQQFQGAVRTLVGRDLVDYEVGPAALRDLMDRARERLTILGGQSNPDISTAAERVDRLLDRLERCQSSRKLLVTGLRGRELNRLQSEFRKALGEEIEQRLTVAVLIALRDQPHAQAGEQQGLISRLTREVDILQRRLNNLVARVARQRELFDRQDHLLSHQEPQVSGVVLFKRDPDGTVSEEYRKCLEEYGGQGYTWGQQRELLAREIISSWSSLIEHVVPQGRIQPGEDWLYLEFNPHVGSPFPPALLGPIIDCAQRPFLRVLRSDVFAKWREFFPGTHREQVREVVHSMHPSVTVDRSLAERGRSPIAVWRVIAIPSQGQHREDFLEAVQAVLPPNCEQVESPHLYRIIVLEEWHRWPLSGVREITMPPNGLCAARCNDFPNFHTRKDVAWTPLTDEEVQRIDEAYRLLVMGILCGYVIPRQGALEIERAQTLGEQRWRLPLSLSAAAYRIVIIGRDLDQQELNLVNTVLGQRVESKRSELGDVGFVRFLIDQLRRGCGSEIPDWRRQLSERAVVRHCLSDSQLRLALIQVQPLPEEVKKSLWKNAGDPKPKGGFYDKPGYYCTTCGGLIGETEDEAMQSGWCCYVNPDHCFYYPFLQA